jgi:hypothetical protein
MNDERYIPGVRIKTKLLVINETPGKQEGYIRT